MTGGKGEQRGLTPRVIEEIFGNIEKAKGALEVRSNGQSYMKYIYKIHDMSLRAFPTRIQVEQMGYPPRSTCKLRVVDSFYKITVAQGVSVGAASLSICFFSVGSWTELNSFVHPLAIRLILRRLAVIVM